MLAGCISAPEGTVQKEVTNLILNGGFEEGTDDTPSQWFIAAIPSSGLKLYRNKTVSHGGKASVSIVNNDESNDACNNWCQNITDFPKGKELMLTGYIKTEGITDDGGVVICIQVFNAEGNFVGFATTQDKYEFKGTHDWTEVKTSVVAPPDAEKIMIRAVLVGTGQVWFDDIQLIVGEEAEPEPLPQFSQGMEGPGIAHAQGHFQITAQENAEIPKIAFPIPLAFEDQVPIYFEIRANPEDALKETVIKKRDEYNWVVELTFNPLKKGNTVEIFWEGYVFIRDHDYNQLPDNVELPKKEELSEEVQQWLVSTLCVQVDNPEIQEKAREIRGERTNIIDIAQKTANFLETGVTRGEFRSLDAVEALHKGGSCTSYANLAAALLRANGIPMRILAVYPTWASSLQTHYIVEFYVFGYGWVRFESTLGKIPWQPYQDIVVAVVTPEDEDRSFEQGRWTGGSGVPWLSLTENLTKYDTSYLGMVDPKMNCDHGAEAVIVFDAEEEKIEEAFNLTWRVWNAYLELITEGQEIPQALAAQRAAVDSTSLEGYIQKMKEAEAIYAEIE